MSGYSEQDLRAILSTVKQTLKGRGLRYADLARGLGVAEVTIKRVFSSGSVSLKHLLAICDFLNVSLLDIAAVAKAAEHPEYVLSPAQDKFLGENPRYYAIFIQLYRRERAADVMKRWSLDDKEFFQTLHALEKLGLIDLLPNNRYRFKMSGAVRGRPGGQLRKMFYKQNLRFLEYAQAHADSEGHLLQASECLLSQAHTRGFLEEMQALTQKYRSLSFTDETTLPEHKKKSVRWLVAFAPYKLDWKLEGDSDR